MLTTLLLLVPILSAQAPTRSAPVVLELDPYFGSLCTLTLTSGEFRGKFMFDTGGGVTLLSLVAAKTLAIEPFGRGTGFRHDGTRVDRPRGGPVTLSAGGWAQRGEIGVIDLAAMLPGLPPVDGILALDFFRGDALTIDLAKKRLTLETPASLTARTQGAPEVELRLAHQAAGAALDVMVGVEGLHGTLWFELDSGNVAPVLVAPHSLVELGLEPLALGKRAHVELPILGLGLEPVEIEAKDLIYDGLLNAAFFERHVLTLDLARGRGWARRTTK